MDIRFYNSLTRRTDPFEPIEPGKVRMYSCGPTVYDFAHIGNFRSFLFTDVLRRFLEVAGLDVHLVMNITDVGHMVDDQDVDGTGEDRMQVAARRIKEDKKSGKVEAGQVENPDDPYQIAQFYTDAYLEDGRALGMKAAFEYPENVLRATEHVPAMIKRIEELIDRGHAYRVDDVVYFSVESFPAYGQLSGNTLDQLREGAGGRVSARDQAAKRHPADFMLWKVDPSHIMKWESPWGAGYPGWHIECSTMAMEKLGVPVIDLHTGGEDLVFPHHECEIAQACGSTGESHFAKHWMHARFLLVEGKKMSKSSGTFFTVRDVLSGTASGKPVAPEVLRYELIKSHYRSNLNFTFKGLGDSATEVRRLQRFVAGLEEATGGETTAVDEHHPILGGCLRALADDLNISEAMGILLPWAKTQPDDPREALAVCRTMNRILNVMPIENELSDAHVAGAGAGGDDVADVCRRIDEARKQKDFDTADTLRQSLIDAGYDVSTTKDGTKAERPLA